MKILVPVKRVLDHTVKININSQKNTIDTENVKMSINPFDANALEEAVQIKEAGKADEVIAVTIGPEKSKEQLLSAMAMGADRAILVKTDIPIDIGGIQPLNVAKTLQKIVKRENISLVLMGKLSIDTDASQTPQMLSALLDWAQATNISSITLTDQPNEPFEVKRETEGQIQTLRLTSPAVISVDLSINNPRYARLPDIMKAKKKPLEVIDMEETNTNLKLLNIAPPPKRPPGIKIPDIDTLVDKLKNEAGVI